MNERTNNAVSRVAFATENIQFHHAALKVIKSKGCSVGCGYGKDGGKV